MGIPAVMWRHSRAAIAGSAVALFWAGLAYDLTRPADYRAYHRTILQVAATAHDAAETGRLTGELLLSGRATEPYARAAFDDATRALAGAQRKFASQPPPDERSGRLRDQVSPLLAREVTALGDTAGATGDTDLKDGVRRLRDLAGQLDAFVTAQR